jgi:predicted nucleotidyltransferase
MSDVVTVPERKARETIRRRSAAASLMTELMEFGHARGGKFLLFGSAAEDRMKFDSDFDVVVDFPAECETEAVDFVEHLCRKHDLPGCASEVDIERALLEPNSRPHGRAAMSDPRWIDVDSDVDDALWHFGMARIFDEARFDAPDLEGYKSSGAFMHAMGTGYTSVEKAVGRILDILGETPPSGKDWHKTLIDRVSRPLTGSIARPAFFDDEMRSDLLECMRMCPSRAPQRLRRVRSAKGRAVRRGG